jgi:hypothetical protein
LEGQLALSWRRCRPCLAYLTGAAVIEGEYALFPGAVAAQPASSLREPSPGIRASLLTQAKFFRHARSCRSPRGDTQLLRLSQQFWRAYFIYLAVATPRLEADAYAGGLNCNGICSLAKFAVGAPLIFWKAELADGKAECYFLACAWRSTPQLRSQRIRAWRERMKGNRLAQAVYGSVPWSCQVDATFPLLCLTLVRTIAVVALTRPPWHRLRRSPKSSRSTAHANVAGARWLQGRRGALEAARQSLGASQLRMLGKWCRDTHGDHAIALREVIFAYPSRLLLLLLIVVNRRTRASARCSFTNASNSSHGRSSAADERRYCNGAWH